MSKQNKENEIEKEVRTKMTNKKEKQILQRYKPKKIKFPFKRKEYYDFKNKVNTNEFEYKEEVREFTGLIFHCPCCNNVFHLHIAEVKLTGSEEKE